MSTAKGGLGSTALEQSTAPGTRKKDEQSTTAKIVVSRQKCKILHLRRQRIMLYDARAMGEMMRAFFLLLLLTSIECALVSGSTINVPADQPTIQAGLDAASNGDTVLVAPGTYFENINFEGKAVVVRSSNGPKETVIDGGKVGTCVTFNSGESTRAVLSGFTIRNGVAPVGIDGGGINIIFSSPTVTNNVITHNTSCAQGGGLYIVGGTPLIKGNTISHNSQTFPCAGGAGGGGIYVAGTGPRIVGNKIVSNSWGAGAGITISSGSPLIQGNIIAENRAARTAYGGGINMYNDSSPVIVQNLIYRNEAAIGAGIYLEQSFGTPGALIIANTIVDNNGAKGSALFAGGFDSSSQIIGNLFVSFNGSNPVYCDGTYDPNPPVFSFNDAFTSGTPLLGSCAGSIGLSGNISADPQFVSANAHVYQLLNGSPAIDAGTNSAPSLPEKDIVGNLRIVDGNGDGTAAVDMGAYEFQQ
jgi:hypothetical protein